MLVTREPFRTQYHDTISATLSSFDFSSFFDDYYCEHHLILNRDIGSV